MLIPTTKKQFLSGKQVFVAVRVELFTINVGEDGVSEGFCTIDFHCCDFLRGYFGIIAVCYCNALQRWVFYLIQQSFLKKIFQESAFLGENVNKSSINRGLKALFYSDTFNIFALDL